MISLKATEEALVTALQTDGTSRVTLDSLSKLMLFLAANPSVSLWVYALGVSDDALEEAASDDIGDSYNEAMQREEARQTLGLPSDASDAALILSAEAMWAAKRQQRKQRDAELVRHLQLLELT